MIDFNKKAAGQMMSRTNDTEELLSKLDSLEGTWPADLNDIKATLEENLEVIKKSAAAIVCVCVCVCVSNTG